MSSMDFFGLYPARITHKRTLPSGRERIFSLHELPIAALTVDNLNRRFALETAVDDKKHWELIVKENAKRTRNLQKSLRHMPFTDIPVGVLSSDGTSVELIHGNRRALSARQEGISEMLVWVGHDLDHDDKEEVRDWPEMNETKVAHSNYSKMLHISSSLQKAKSSVEREERIHALKEKGIKVQEIAKAENTVKLMHGICDRLKLNPNDRAHQIKTFETAESLYRKDLSLLSRSGDFEKVELLSGLIDSFIQNSVAHDDMKVTVSGLAALKPDDPVFEEIKSGKRDITKRDTLKDLTLLARSISESRSPAADVRSVLNQAISVVMSNGSAEQRDEVIMELEAALRKLRALRMSTDGGAA